MRSIIVCVLVSLVLAAQGFASTVVLVPDRAPAGARVLAVGNALATATVSVETSAGQTPAIVVARSATFLEFVVPANAITGPVQVTNGGAALDSATLTIVASPPFTRTTTLVSGLGAPTSVAVSLPDGRLAVADAAKHQVRILQPSGATVHIFGSGKPGLRDGNDAVAQFKDPSGVAFDPETGDIYVADTGNHAIRKISGNTVATVAGSGRPGFRNGDRADAQFHRPMGIAVASDGEIVVADTGNHAIRRISTAGDVSTIAGTGAPGFRDGASATAQFHAPEALVGAGEAIYVTDTQNHVVRKLAGSIVSTIAGTTHPGMLDGAALMSEFHAPGGIAVSESGSVYIGDTRNHALRAVSDVVARLAGSQPGYVDGNLAIARFHEPRGIAWAGALFVADTKNGAVRAVYSGVAASAVYPAQGDPRGGEMIRVFGAGFVPGATGVTVGGLATAVQFVTSTELLVTTPAHAVGAVDIIVTTPGGSASLEGAFRYTPPFVAVELSPAGATLDEGQTIQFTATGIASDGTTSDLTAQAIWSSSVAGVATVDATGSVRAVFPGLTRITATVDSLSASADVEVRNPEPLPPDPATVAPPLRTTELTSFADGTSFLYSGPNPIQTGVAPGTIEQLRASVTRGVVRTREGLPLGGVKVRILDHPEYGQTLTRADGMYDLVVNGGTTYAVTFEKSGYIPGQRHIYTPWQDFAIVEDIVMIQYDDAASALVAGASELQVARASMVSDSDGQRRATLLMPAGTSAAITLPDGSTRQLDRLAIRMTEYTVGPNGPKAMPAQLPPQTGYTYCVELSVDEAVAANAATVTFDKPLAFYVENFIGFAVGSAVPVGYYDRQSGTWIATDNGRVIKILGMTSGTADLDADGDGIADTAEALAAHGITGEERVALADLYAAGASLWRVPVEHFSPLDLNWPSGPPLTAEPPLYLTPKWSETVDDPMSCPASIVRCDNQTLGEVVPVEGTPFTLAYNSGRVRGRRAEHKMLVPVTGDQIPAGLKSINLAIEIGGKVMQQTFPAVPGQTFTFSWDGYDAYGREVANSARAFVRLGHVYETVFYESRADARRAFNRLSGVPLSIEGRADVELSGNWTVPLGNARAEHASLGGWTLSSHHIYDYSRRTLLFGNGEQRSVDVRDVQKYSLRTAAGRTSVSDGSGVATRTPINDPWRTVVGADGTLYMNEWNVIRRVTPGGAISRVAGTGVKGFSGDGGPAVDAKINARSTIAIGPDGSLYFADTNNFRIRRVRDGIIDTIAGNGQKTDRTNLEEDVPATEARINPLDVAVGPDGSIYFADDFKYIRWVTPDGLIQTVAGGGTNLGDFAPPRQIRFNSLEGLAVAPDGSIVFTDERTFGWVVRRISPEGLVRTLGGGGTHCGGLEPFDGPVQSACFGASWFPSVGLDGTIYLPDTNLGRVRAITPDGIVRTIAGNGTRTGPLLEEGAIATGSRLFQPWGVSTAPDGKLYVSDVGIEAVCTLAPDLPRFQTDDTAIPAGDGTLLVFDGSRHLRTVDALTGATLYSFGYDSGGRLASVTDIDGNATVIERASDGTPMTIVAPGGQRTTLTTDGNGYLQTIVNSAGHTHTLTHTSNGLLTEFRTPRFITHAFTYDEEGRLRSDSAPDGHNLTLTRSGTGDDWSVTTASSLGRTTTMSRQRETTGAKRRLAVFSTGLSLDTTKAASGVATTLTPEGMLVTSTFTPDPRHGMSDPLSTTQIRFPSGRLLNITASRSATLAEPGNPASLTTLTDRFTMNDRTTTTTYTAATRTLIVTTPAGRTSSAQVDSARRPLVMTAPGLSATAFQYSGGLITGLSRDARAYSFAYDTRRRLTSITDPMERTTSFGYDDADRIVARTLPNDEVISYAYDAGGNLTSVTPPSRPSHRFSFTFGNQIASYTAPLSSPLLYAYDGERKLTRMTQADGSHIDFGYDAVGRMAAITAADVSVSIARDTAGRVNRVTSPLETLEYEYDGGLLTRVTLSGEVSGTVNYEYDENLRRQREEVGGSGIAFGWDADDLLTQVGLLTLTRRTDNGLLSGSTVGAVADVLTYDAFGDLATYIASFDGSPFYSATYDRDLVGRISGRTEVVAGVTLRRDYVYDPVGRLVRVQSSDGALAEYGYDANGNRIEHRSLGGTAQADYDAEDRAIAYDGGTYEYTPTGYLASRTLSGATTTYVYDSFGNLQAVALPGGSRIEYVIDPQNRRVGKKRDGALVQGWIYSNQLQIAADVNAAGAIVTRFVYGTRSHVPDYMVRDGATYRVIADHAGSPRLVVNVSNGAVAQRLDYDEFGNVLYDSNPGFQPFGFAGGLYDRDTRLVRFGVRDYDPHTGRWTAKDPLGFSGGSTNLYEYVASDPVNSFDPSGFSGQLSIYSSDNAGSSAPVYDGHSWIVYTPDGGSATSYGTFGILVEAPRGLNTNWEVDRWGEYGSLTGDYDIVSRTMWIDDTQEAAMMAEIERYRRMGDDAWTSDNPCTGFSTDAWRAATGETLPDKAKGDGWPNPGALNKSIRKLNGGLGARVVKFRNE